MIALVSFIRLRLLKGKKVDQAVTWDCGYALPTPKMQYTASSFAQPILNLFHMLLGPRGRRLRLADAFPKEAALHTETSDVFQKFMFRPAFAGVRRGLDALRWLQHGNVHLYILYILITLLVLLFWKLG